MRRSPRSSFMIEINSLLNSRMLSKSWTICYDRSKRGDKRWEARQGKLVICKIKWSREPNRFCQRNSTKANAHWQHLKRRDQTAKSRHNIHLKQNLAIQKTHHSSKPRGPLSPWNEASSSPSSRQDRSNQIDQLWGKKGRWMSNGM